MKTKTKSRKKKSQKGRKKSKKKITNINVGFMHLNKSNDNNVNVLNKKLVSETNFGGYPLDLLFGIIYLKRKHPSLLALPFDIKKLLLTYSDDLRDRYPFTFVGCVFYKCREEIIQNGKKLKFNSSNFELELPGKVSIKDFKATLLKARNRKKRFTIIPLIFRWNCGYEFEGHANILIFDFKNNTVERFEPYGFISAFTPEETKVSNSFNIKFKELLRQINLNITYLDQSSFIRKGPQFLEEVQINKNKILRDSSDPEGFCGAWSLWYADLRLSNPDKESKELIEIAVESIKKNKQLRIFIRNYSVFLVKERYAFLKKIKQKNPYNHVLGEQLLSLKDKKSAIASLLKTNKILNEKIN